VNQYEKEHLIDILLADYNGTVNDFFIQFIDYTRCRDEDFRDVVFRSESNFVFRTLKSVYFTDKKVFVDVGQRIKVKWGKEIEVLIFPSRTS